MPGTGSPAGTWALRWREPELDAGVIAAVMGASVVFGVLPGVIEFAHSWQQRGRTGPAAAITDLD